MDGTTIDQLIINSPYEEPSRFWSYDRDTRRFTLTSGRRPAGYVVATQGSKSFDDPGVFIELPLVNKIRPRVKKWRESGYPLATGITRRLLEHWYDREQREHPLFFCQLEAVETLMWLAEAPDADKVGIEIPSDGGQFLRLCSKMATGSGKTIVMAMVIAWQVLNKATYSTNPKYSKNVLVVAPGLTVKSRLGVLMPAAPDNFYDKFSVVPPELMERFRQARVQIINWQVLNWETEERLAKRRRVDKRGPKSDQAYAREVLKELGDAKDLVVINDEAHHAWRVPAESKVKGIKKEDIDEATKWVGGLDRIHRARGIRCCFDFSATPFSPSGKTSSEEALFGWIVSDFNLNDAIESGLVKTPRVVIRDDGLLTKEARSRFYHIFNDPEVKDDLNRKAEEHEPLPDLVVNGYYLLGLDWLETAKRWGAEGRAVPPVMITVANTTHTAARVKYAFDHGKIRIAELLAPEKTLHIDTKVLDQAEGQLESLETEDLDETADEDSESGRKLTKKEQAIRLRRMVDTVGQEGKPGGAIQNVISVGMLSEGWDARTVTHIMGLRAFSSQLLCEQVVGRGLRRTSYEVNPDTGLYEPEYVNIFGVPFTFLPHEGGDGPVPPPPEPKTPIEPDPNKVQFEITWPNILRVEHVLRPRLDLDLTKLKPLELNAAETATIAQMAPVVEGKPDVTRVTEIDLQRLGREQRTQRIIFETARDIFDQTKPSWRGNREYLLAQIIRLVERFVNSSLIHITPGLFNQDPIRRRVLITLNMNKLVQHMWEAITFTNTESLTPVFDQDRPVRSTGDMGRWYTGKPHGEAARSHINFCVYDSSWEATEAAELDRNPNVEAWVKNDHLGFEVLYVYGGVVHKYRPDFLIRLTNGTMLVLETKGKDSPQNKTKRAFLDEWVRAVNEHGGFGQWQWAVSFDPADLPDILETAGTD